jgi:leucyl aminopeptidase
MHLSVETRDPARSSVELLALPLPAVERSRWRLPSRIAAVDQALGGALSAVVRSGDFGGKPGETLWFYPNGRIPAARILLIGLGEEGRLDAQALRRAAGHAVEGAAKRRARRLALVVPATRRVRPPGVAQALAEGAILGCHRSNSYQTQEEEPLVPPASAALLIERATDARAMRSAVAAGSVLAECQNLARRLSNEPANALPPASLAREAQRVAKEVGLRCRVLDVAELRRRKLGALLAVGQGSANPPRLIVLEHNRPRRGRRTRRSTICIVGKGITFDSGGISIKPAAGMQDMKHDMSGAAAVVGILRAAAVARLPLHVVGILAAAENLPSGKAYRPGDIVTSMSGKTIEIQNTDAEGRLVLADALHFARSEFAPQAIIDLATLTGACVIALGRWASGLFGTHDRLVEHLRRAGEATGERAWPMPLWEEHSKHMRSRVADLKNVGGREAGAATAAAFLAAFVGDTPWAHLDIAGTAWTDKSDPIQPYGATGVGVRLVTEALRGWRDARLV